MASLATDRQDALFITLGVSDAEARAVQRRAKNGELVRLVEGVYVAVKKPEAQAAIVKRNWRQILGALVPGGVVSYRSAYAGGITSDGAVIISNPTRYNRTIQLPGLRAILVKGPGALDGDMPLGNKLYFASRERQLLENLTRSRGEHGRSAGGNAVEKHPHPDL